MTVYSNDGEDFSFHSAEEAHESAISQGEENPTVWKAKAIPHRASEFVPDIVDIMLNQAADSSPYGIDWDINCKDARDLQKKIERVVNKWAKKTGNEPTWWAVTSIKETEPTHKDE